MEIIPAIDLKDAKAVRLFKGQMNSAKIYSNDPSELAKVFENFGARYLHIVDLDGAIAGEAINFKTIEKIATKTSLKIEVGGGIRDEARKWRSARYKRYLRAFRIPANFWRDCWQGLL